jgi:predicted 2-oxoglutarate/Fe(II)-dependent dioxygenase YbiX
VQSAIRSPAQRAILYDLGSASRLLEVLGAGADPDVLALQACEQNLLRMWCEP